MKPGPESVVHDFPAGGWRIKEPAVGIHMTIVNGQILLEDGKHTGALPGRVISQLVLPGSPELRFYGSSRNGGASGRSTAALWRRDQ